MLSDPKRLAATLLALVTSFIWAANSSALTVEKIAVPGAPESAGRQHSATAETSKASIESALAAMNGGRYEEARILFLQVRKGLDPRTAPMAWLTLSMNACQALSMQGKSGDAEQLARQTTQACEAVLGLEDPLTAEAMAYEAFILKMHGHPASAEPVYRRTVVVLEAKYGRLNPAVVAAQSRHGALLHLLGRQEEAEATQRRALSILQELGNEEDPNLCQPLTNLAYCLHTSGKTHEALPLMERALDLVRRHADASITSAGTVLRRQAEFFRDIGRLECAEELGARALVRLARRPEFNRARFYYYDTVTSLYRSILAAEGLMPQEIDARIQALQATAATHLNTASRGR